MSTAECMWRVNNTLTDLTRGSRNLSCVIPPAPPPLFLGENTMHLLISGLISISCVTLFSNFGYETNNPRGRARAISTLGHLCLCMALSLGPSVSCLSHRSPYLLAVSLLLMILKPLFSLKRVWPVPVGREQQSNNTENNTSSPGSLQVFGETRHLPLLAQLATHVGLVKGTREQNKFNTSGG